jgi:hypothetical protein
MARGKGELSITIIRLRTQIAMIRILDSDKDNYEANSVISAPVPPAPEVLNIITAIGVPEAIPALEVPTQSEHTTEPYVYLLSSMYKPTLVICTSSTYF